MNSNKNIKLIIVIILLIGSIGTLGYRFDLNAKDNGYSNIFDYISKKIKKINIFGSFDVDSFNMDYENYIGNQSGLFLETPIENIITNNLKNTDHKVELIVNDESYGTDSNKIQGFLDSIDSSLEYSVSVNYDEDGYINQFIVKSKKKKISYSVINNPFEIHAGTTSGFLLETHIASLITNNKKYPDYAIAYIKDGENFGTDPDVIQTEKDKIDDNKKYELSFNYDDEGYIIEFVVKTK